MTPPLAVIDTNVIVSGLITSERAAPTATILDGMLGGRFTYVLSLDLLAAYRAVLLRPAIRRRHGLTAAEVDVILTELALNGTVHEPASSGEALAEVGDRHLWALLEGVASAVLVTGDDVLRRHAPAGTPGDRPAIRAACRRSPAPAPGAARAPSPSRPEEA